MALNDTPPIIFDIPIGENADRIPIEKTPNNTKLNYIDAFSQLFATRLDQGGVPLKREEFNQFLFMFSKLFSWDQYGNEIGWMDEIGNTTGYPLGARLVYYLNNDVTKRRVLISTKDNNKDNFTQDQSFINQSWFVDNGFGIGSEIRWTPTDEIITIGDNTYQIGQFVDEYHPNLTIGGLWKPKWNTSSVFTRTEGILADENRNLTNGIQDYADKRIVDYFLSAYDGSGNSITAVDTDNTNKLFQKKGVKIGNGIQTNTLGNNQRDAGIIIEYNNSRVVETSENETRPRNIKERIMVRYG